MLSLATIEYCYAGFCGLITNNNNIGNTFEGIMGACLKDEWQPIDRDCLMG